MLGCGPDQTISRSLILTLAGPTSAATTALPTGDGWLRLPEPGGVVKETAFTFLLLHRLILMSGSMSESSLVKVAGVKLEIELWL